MFRSPLSFFLVAFFALLAGKVAALDINITTFDKSTRIVQATDFLSSNISDVVRSDCNAECQPGVNAINACGTDNSCLCNTTTTIPLVVSCEECMFEKLIARFKKPDDPLAGQTNALTAYMTSCNNATNSTLDSKLFALHVPDNWDGPFGQGLNLPTTIVAVIFTTIFGGGLISVLCTM
ncbi:hypothetical protein C8Q80DRAFT_1273380 [Daedaleopsis nitida]|nr:hypothetical protein C8Q80DRAFT_1273380 [Daedaleopsis nitida]